MYPSRAPISRMDANPVGMISNRFAVLLCSRELEWYADKSIFRLPPVICNWANLLV